MPHAIDLLSNIKLADKFILAIQISIHFLNQFRQFKKLITQSVWKSTPIKNKKTFTSSDHNSTEINWNKKIIIFPILQECHFNSTSYNAVTAVHGNHVNKEPSQSDVGAGSDTGIQIRAVTLLMPTLHSTACTPHTHAHTRTKHMEQAEK